LVVPTIFSTHFAISRTKYQGPEVMARGRSRRPGEEEEQRRRREEQEQEQDRTACLYNWMEGRRLTQHSWGDSHCAPKSTCLDMEKVTCDIGFPKRKATAINFTLLSILPLGTTATITTASSVLYRYAGYYCSPDQTCAAKQDCSWNVG